MGVHKRKSKARLRKGSLKSALEVMLKQKGGRKDIEYTDAPQIATRSMHQAPLKERAGYPLTRANGSMDPAKWRTVAGKEIIVDFSRVPWLPDDWGQGVKTTNPTAHSTGGTGGTYTVFMSPQGKAYYHKHEAERTENGGKLFTLQDGLRGQLRRFWLQGKHSGFVLDKDATLFKILSSEERRHLPSKEKLHVAIISARRASTPNGVRDIAVVQTAFTSAGVTPTWYVDAESLKCYQDLGLNAVAGGKLTAARNRALEDAQRKGKICVQVSDDISSWEYREGPQAKERSDDAVNAAYAAATRCIVSPVAAARFIVAKMRSAPGKHKPQLGGIYMLSSCARTFAGTAFSRQHFILGDFFVVDKSKVRFDPKMTLKEDYDFTCAHIKSHGSVMRCNRMTLNVKHYSNSGGACSNRDRKGLEEKKNVGILFRKWPNAFRKNPKRKNEVILKWKGTPPEEEDDDNIDIWPTVSKPQKRKCNTGTSKTSAKKRLRGSVK